MSTPTYATRESFLRSIARRTTTVTLSDGSQVLVREPLLADRFAAQEAGNPDPETFVLRNPAAFYAMLTIRCACAADGTPLFTDADLPALCDARTGTSATSDTWQIGDVAWALAEGRPDDLKSVGAAADSSRDDDAGHCAPDADRDAGADAA